MENNSQIRKKEKKLGGWYICPSCKKVMGLKVKEVKNVDYIAAYCVKCHSELRKIRDYVNDEFVSREENR